MITYSIKTLVSAVSAVSAVSIVSVSILFNLLVFPSPGLALEQFDFQNPAQWAEKISDVKIFDLYQPVPLGSMSRDVTTQDLGFFALIYREVLTQAPEVERRGLAFVWISPDRKVFELPVRILGDAPGDPNYHFRQHSDGSLTSQNQFQSYLPRTLAYNMTSTQIHFEFSGPFGEYLRLDFRNKIDRYGLQFHRMFGMPPAQLIASIDSLKTSINRADYYPLRLQTIEPSIVSIWKSNPTQQGAAKGVIVHRPASTLDAKDWKATFFTKTSSQDFIFTEHFFNFGTSVFHSGSSAFLSNWPHLQSRANDGLYFTPNIDEWVFSKPAPKRIYDLAHVHIPITKNITAQFFDTSSLPTRNIEKRDFHLVTDPLEQTPILEAFHKYLQFYFLNQLYGQNVPNNPFFEMLNRIHPRCSLILTP